MQGIHLTQTDVDNLIAKADFHVFPDTTVTACCLTLKNGYNVVGTSACVDPANFDEVLGRVLARKDAAQKIWALEGYALKNEFNKQQEQK